VLWRESWINDGVVAQYLIWTFDWCIENGVRVKKT